MCHFSTTSFPSLCITKVQDFIVLVSGADSLYGLCPDTLTSLVLTLLPPVDHVYEELGELNLVDDSAEIESFVLKEIILALREYSGLFIPKLVRQNLAFVSRKF